MKAITSACSLLLLAVWSMSFTHTFPAKTWKHLGSRTVNYSLDKDVIHIGAREGGFRKIKLKVSGGNLHMHRLVVQYGNGQRDKIPLKHYFKHGSDSRLIDLEGKQRVIQNITVWYDTRNSSRKKAKLHIFGRH